LALQASYLRTVHLNYLDATSASHRIAFAPSELCESARDKTNIPDKIGHRLLFTFCTIQAQWKGPERRNILNAVVNTAPATCEVATPAAHDEWKEVDTAISAITSALPLPVVLMKISYHCQRSNSNSFGHMRCLTSEVVLFPLGI
jgi:hypothetical protein